MAIRTRRKSLGIVLGDRTETVYAIEKGRGLEF
jgi:hypothetical protein